MNTHRQAGFSLMELLIAMAIVGVLAVVGLPNLREFVYRQNLEARANALVINLNFARGEAISRNNSRGVGFRSYDPSNSDWSDGWQVCSDDADRDGTWCETNTDPFELLRESTFDDNIVISANTGVFIYQSSGMIDVVTGVTFTVCDSHIPKHGRVINVAPTGRVSITATEHDCSS